MEAQGKSMANFYEDFIQTLDRQDREAAVSLCLNALSEKRINVTTLYLEILTPALNRLVFSEKEQDRMIWQEHNQSSLVRTIIEAAFPYVIAERKEMNLEIGKKVLVICPEAEEHELGARMAADFFTIWGFHTTFIGARTPTGTLIKAIESVRPDILTFSITNYFNLVSTKRTIARVREQFSYPFMILAGGNACVGKPDAAEMLGADRILDNLQDIEQIRKEMDS